MILSMYPCPHLGIPLVGGWAQAYARDPYCKTKNKIFFISHFRSGFLALASWCLGWFLWRQARPEWLENHEK